ncbi:YCF48-related protein [Prolixibacteraceae bacterium Z1-6]|uniref:YCF48-related protein n=1 Tax=Draconibacterium aestuarii TaxID=2998507 RepID=A0A9X3F6W3_9BACT|nr:YCF48-related protein [Prolixibacteraceae bacterium Z1-6]
MLKYLSRLLLCFLAFQSCTSSRENIVEPFFTELESHTNGSLRGLHVVNENVIWASGSGGTVLLSNDGGETWDVNSITGAEANDFRSIYAWNENTAMVFGVSGPEFAYRTNDGGKSWEVVFQDTTAGLFFNSLKFVDTKNGLAVSDPIDGKFFVLRTENGGDTWEWIADFPDVEEGEANFAASNTCIEYLPSGKAWIASGGKAARVFYSSDFGKTWEVAKTPMIRGLSSSGIFSVSFKNDREGIIVGGIYDQPEVNTNIAAYTVDGGKNWLPAVTMPKEYRSCAQYVGSGRDKFVFAIGKTGSDFSHDNGMNWQFLGEEGFYTFRAVPGKLSGFAAGANGKIAKVEFEIK